MRTGLAAASGLLFAVLAATGVGAGLYMSQSHRPPATGAVGQLEVYGQRPSGPVRLWPDRTRRWPRPQHVAFRFSVEGSGPRMVRIEVETDDERFTAYEEVHHAPARQEPLEYVLRLGETAPDRIDLWITIEAPHAPSVRSRFPMVLTGPSRRFWEAEDDAE